MPQQQFCNPYHFVPVDKPPKKKKEESTPYEHWLAVADFDDVQKQHENLQHYSHAAYHPNTFSGRILCRITTEEAMFVGALREQPDSNKAATVLPFELEGQAAIPASTLRGLISSTAETASRSALRVLNDQVLSFRKAIRKAMPESLSALGMVVIEQNEQGEKVYSLKPLSLPTLEGHGRHGFTFHAQNDAEKKAYSKMFDRFEKNACLKVYLNGYRGNHPIADLANKKTYSHEHPEFYYAQLSTHRFNNVGDPLLHVKRSYVIGQKIINSSPILTEQEWQQKPIEERKLYTRGILRILGKEGRDLPDTKKHELFIPYPPQIESGRTFPILPEAIERFHQLADDRTDAGEKPPLPYEPLGTKRHQEEDQFLQKELGKKGLKHGELALRVKAGDIVYFRPTLKDNQAVVAEIAFSSIWRGRVELESGTKASVHDFFKNIDEELLPFQEGRQFISPAELLFGFVQKEEEKTNSDSGRAFAGRVQFSFGQLAPGQAMPPYQEKVLLKNLLSPKLPCPMMYFKMYFKNRYTKSQEYIHKSELNPYKHRPQGRKMYVHNHKTQHGKKPWRSVDKDNPKTHKLKTYITPVRENTEFYFHLDFNNLTEWELGLLFYALRPTEEFRHKLGMGKPIGLGRVRIDIMGILFIDREQRYCTKDLFQAPRYHQAWLNNEISPDVYPREQQAAQQAKNLPFHWEDLRKAFRSRIASNVINALELIGDPNKVPAVVHTPQIGGIELDEPKMERKNFDWFVNNNDPKKHGSYQMLTPLDKNSTELPTLNRG